MARFGDREWAADMPIWDNKHHVARRVLTGDDGPVPTFRRWYSQFYSEDAAIEEAIASDRNPLPKCGMPKAECGGRNGERISDAEARS